MAQQFTKRTTRKDRPQSAFFIGTRLSADGTDIKIRTKTEIITLNKEIQNFEDVQMTKEDNSTKVLSTSPTSFGTKAPPQKSRSSIQIGGSKLATSSAQLKSGRSHSAESFPAHSNQDEEEVEQDAICTLASTKNTLGALPSDVIIEIAYFLEPEGKR